MEQTKELHLATSITALDEIAVDQSIKTLSSKKHKLVIIVAKKLYAKCQTDPFDEEMTYVRLRRFLLVYDNLLSRSTDKNYIQLLFNKEAAQAGIQIRELRSGLIKRYEAAKTFEVDMSTESVASTVTMSTTSVFSDQMFISCEDLFGALSRLKVKILIIDTRNETDFADSHIKCDTCINIPEDKIQDGLSAHRLGGLLPEASVPLWEKRDKFDAIVLVDWDTTKANFVASKMHKLRVTISEWDIGRQYKEQPVVLNYGFVEWLEMYPMYCTKSNVLYVKTNQDLEDLLNLVDIVYPMDAEPKITPSINQEETKESPRIDGIESRNDILQKEEVIVKKINDVATEILECEKKWKHIHEEIINEGDNLKLNQLIDQEKLAEEKITSLSNEEQELQKIRNHLTDNFDFAASFKPGTSQEESDKLSLISKLDQSRIDLTKARDALSKERQKLLDTARQAKKPVLKKAPTKPAINRATKPKSIPLIKPLPNRIEGQLGRVTDGLTGLYNIKNTCYMNAIIQCLRHLPQVYHYYCNGIYINETSRPPFLTNEMAHVIRALWSNTHIMIKPSKLYQKLVTLKKSYASGNHEDCMEFFLSVINYLSEDCSTTFSSKPFWSESQMAWYKQHNGKRSFYINNFYHQMKVETHCPDCQPVPTVKFEIENVVYLHLPNATSFNLEESFKSYVNSIESIPCKKCKKYKFIKKTMNIYPNILVISLKRHLQDYSTGKLKCIKNSSDCIFSFNGLDVENVRYSLKAIALHGGTVDEGHYTAGCLNPINNEWFLFDDETVSVLNRKNPILREKVYGLFYAIDDDSIPDITISDTNEAEVMHY